MLLLKEVRPGDSEGKKRAKLLKKHDLHGLLKLLHRQVPLIYNRNIKSVMGWERAVPNWMK